MTALVQETDRSLRATAADRGRSHVARVREWIVRTRNLIRYSREASRAYEQSRSAEERQAVLTRFLVNY